MVHSLGSYANPVEIFFKISPDHLNIDMSWHVRMIETIKQPLETLLMTPRKWPIWVILHCKKCTFKNFCTEGAHHFSYPENFIASRKCKVTPSKNTVAAWVCSICEYSNKTSTNVRTHIETHHAPESLKRVQCLYCGYVCPSRSALRMHVKKHQS